LTKEQLKEYKHIKHERDNLATMIKELEATMYSPRGTLLDGMPHGGGGNGSPIESMAAKHDELLGIYQEKVAELTAKLQTIEAAIEPLAPRERTLLRLYYINGLTWEQVCVAMNYGWTQVHRIHGRALRELKKEEAPE
jgi:RNA polymerase sigma factor (sigma-70 family)